MMIRSLRAALIGFLALAPFAAAQAGKLQGTVKNGTNGKPGAGIEITLIQLQGGMSEVAHTKSDSQGNFTFDHPSLGTQPMLLRASYNDINFNQAVPPGTSTIEVNIYEPSKDAKTIDVPSRILILQPDGETLTVAEQYQIENNSQPQVAYYRKDGSFDFVLPDKGFIKQVAAAGPAGMPVVQLPMDKKKNRYSIAYAFRPGKSEIRYSYEVPYAGSSAVLKLPTVYPGGRFVVAAPPSMQVSGDGLKAAGLEQGMNVYIREDVPSGTVITLNVSGTAPPATQANAGGGQGAMPQNREEQQGSGDSGGGVPIQQVPSRLDSFKWPLIVGFVAVFGLLAFMLSKKQVAMVTVPASTHTDSGHAAPVARRAEPVVAHIPAPIATQTPAARPATTGAPTTLDEIESAVASSLEALKEQLFKLELRRQAGTITEEEYTQERARTEKVLRNLVRG
jgi:hypothetical protein